MLSERDYFSIGGGFVLDQDEVGGRRIVPDSTPVRYPFSSGAELVAQCVEHGKSVSDIMLANELSWRTEAEVRAGCCTSGRSCRSACSAAPRPTGCCPAG